MMWFGPEMKGTPFSKDHPEIPVPAGETCSYCGTVITDYDSGDALPLVTSETLEDLGCSRPMKFAYRHKECAIYSIQGSRWCRSEGVEQKTPQHRRYHQLEMNAHGMMRPRAIERRVLMEFNEYISEEELINNWRTEK